jgi:hypothetical protein
MENFLAINGTFVKNVFLVLFVISSVIAMPAMQLTNSKRFVPQNTINYNLENGAFQYGYNIFKTNRISYTPVYEMHKFHNAYKDGNKTNSSPLPSTWHSSSSLSSTTTNSGNKQNKEDTILIVVGIVLGGVVAIYSLYLLLLLSVVTWKYIFEKFNLYNYVEIIQ